VRIPNCTNSRPWTMCLVGCFVFSTGSLSMAFVDVVGATESTDLADRFASDNPGPEELTEASRRHRYLEAAWERLSTEQRALLGLHAEGYKLSELAQITGRSRNALSARLHRARMRLSKLINQELPTKERLAHLEKQNELS